MGTNVEFLTRDVALIAKQDGSVLVGRKGTTILIVSADRSDIESGRPLILLAKECADEDAAVRKMLYLVGKMCRKDEDSKYFANQHTVPNMTNGAFGYHRKMDYIKWAEEIKEVLCGPRNKSN